VSDTKGGRKKDKFCIGRFHQGGGELPRSVNGELVHAESCNGCTGGISSDIGGGGDAHSLRIQCKFHVQRGFGRKKILHRKKKSEVKKKTITAKIGIGH